MSSSQVVEVVGPTSRSWDQVIGGVGTTTSAQVTDALITSEHLGADRPPAGAHSLGTCATSLLTTSGKDRTGDAERVDLAARAGPRGARHRRPPTTRCGSWGTSPNCFGVVPRCPSARVVTGLPSGRARWCTSRTTNRLSPSQRTARAARASRRRSLLRARFVLGPIPRKPRADMANDSPRVLLIVLASSSLRPSMLTSRASERSSCRRSESYVLCRIYFR